MSFACVLHFPMSSSAFHPHVFQNLHPFGFSRFSPLSVRSPDLSRAPVALSDLVSCAGVKLSRTGPRFSKRPWYSTGRLPVKFRAIWSSFDTPTVNRVTVKPISLCSPTPLPKWPKTHQTLFHAVGRSITIVWAKTAPHLDSPNSQNL